jgi:hypothetical protein
MAALVLHGLPRAHDEEKGPMSDHAGDSHEENSPDRSHPAGIRA